uniref:Uncharacterized protein n=1 Tax=Triticum urartu TaxID=4572 RepID=A0A8R7R210_TRIUA
MRWLLPVVIGHSCSLVATHMRFFFHFPYRLVRFERILFLLVGPLDVPPLISACTFFISTLLRLRSWIDRYWRYINRTKYTS